MRELKLTLRAPKATAEEPTSPSGRKRRASRSKAKPNVNLLGKALENVEGMNEGQVKTARGSREGFRE